MNDAITREVTRHLQFAATKCATFVGREALLSALRAHWGGLLTAASGDTRCVRGYDGALRVRLLLRSMQVCWRVSACIL